MNNGPACLVAGAVGVAGAPLLGAPLAHAETEKDGDSGDYIFTVAANSETSYDPGEALVTVAVSLAVATEAVESTA